MATDKITASINPADALTASALAQIERQQKCPYCHGTPEDHEDTRAFQANEDGQIGADVNHVCWVNLYGHIPTLEIECDYSTYETTPIHYCPMCGRRLEASHE